MLCLLSLPTHAASKKPTGPPAPGSKAALTAALSLAQKIYLRYGGDENSANGYTADYTAFYQDMQTWGRYQLLPSTEGADLVIQYTAFCRDVCSITVYDGKTMAWVGGINQYLGGSTLHVSNTTRAKGAAKFIKTLGPYAGPSHSANSSSGQQVVPPPILPLPAWASPAGSGSAPSVVEEHISIGVPYPGNAAFQNAFLEWVKTQHKVLIIDDELSLTQNSPFGRKDVLTLFENDLNAWGRYKIVSSLADADFVMDVDGNGYCDQNSSCTYSLNASIRDPKTLRVLANNSFRPTVEFNRKKQADPFPGSLQDFVDAIRVIVGDPL